MKNMALGDGKQESVLLFTSLSPRVLLFIGSNASGVNSGIPLIGLSDKIGRTRISAAYNCSDIRNFVMFLLEW